MLSSLARQASHGATALKRAVAWSARISAERRAMRQLARMSDCELSDIGLVRQDIVDAAALRHCNDSPASSERRGGAHKRSATERTDWAA